MDDLFSASTRERSFQNAPLAVRMRPNSLDEYVGQQKAVGKGSWLRAAIEHDVLSSVILYGPAGTGKTTLAHIIANHTKSEFVEVSAVTGTVKDLRRVIDEAKTRLNTYDRRTILFIDEIHRFSKSQQVTVAPTAMTVVDCSSFFASSFLSPSPASSVTVALSLPQPARRPAVPKATVANAPSAARRLSSTSFSSFFIMHPSYDPATVPAHSTS